MSARIVVLGADGFIGRQVLAALAASDWAAPVAAGRRTVDSASFGGVERVQINATDAESMRAALTGASGVVNCIYSKPETLVAEATALYGAAAASNAAVVDFSSMAVYGAATGTVDEDSPLRADTGPYAAAKAEAERIARSYARSVSLRPGIVYGRGSPQWSLRIARWLKAGRVGDLGRDGDGLCNLVHVDDVAAAVLACLQKPAALGRAYNLGLSEPPTWNEYFMRYGRALGAVPIRRITQRQMKLEKLAAVPLKVAEIVCAKAGISNPLPPPIPPSMAALWRQEIRLDVRSAEHELGMVWKPLGEGLAEAATTSPSAA